MTQKKILDHGFVELIEAWGTGKDGKVTRPERDSESADYEIGIIEAARQSTSGSFRGWESDSKLLASLYNRRHDTPFEFAGMVIEVQAPIMVFREWHRHRTQSYNEMSARYAPLPDLVYAPSTERLLMVNAKTGNKQAQGVKDAPDLTGTNAKVSRTVIQDSCSRSREDYELLLSLGVAKESARGVLPFFQYSKMRACANLRNWLAFMTLRCDPNAQWEIQQYALAVADLVKATFPQTYGLWERALERGKNQQAVDVKHAELKAELRRYFEAGQLDITTDLYLLLRECENLTAS